MTKSQSGSGGSADSPAPYEKRITKFLNALGALWSAYIRVRHDIQRDLASSNTDEEIGVYAEYQLRLSAIAGDLAKRYGLRKEELAKKKRPKRRKRESSILQDSTL